jgi:hypothetical protein
MGLKGVARRSAFVIDREGVVRYAEVLESAGDLPDFQKVRDTLGGPAMIPALPIPEALSQPGKGFLRYP